MELWKSCKGYEGAYEVSSMGRVRSLDRCAPRSDNGAMVFYEGIVLKQLLDKRGYPCVYLSKNNNSKRDRVHRLVAIAFLENPDSKPQVNHIDGVKTNNNVSNLEWVTNQENMTHAVETGLYKDVEFGTKATAFTGSVEAYNSDGKLVATMSGNAEMALLGFDYRLVSAVLKGKRNSHKGCTFIKLNKEI